MRLLFFSILFSLTRISFAQAPTQTVRGQVVDNQTRSALPGVVVLLIDTGRVMQNTAADVDGNFRLENVPVGRHLLVFRFISYKETSIPVIVTSGKEVVLTVLMEESVAQQQEVTITADTKTKPRNEMTTVSARTFTIEETQRYAGSLGDPSRMASNYAGVSGAEDSRNDVVIRGNSPLGLLWRLNGADIPNPNHFGSFGSTGGPVSMLNNNVLDNSDFMTGAFPAEYGNALSGVFDLRMRNGNNEKFEFLGQIGFNGFEMGIEGPLSKKHNASFLINYRYSTLVLFTKIGLEFGIGDAVPKYQDISFKFNFPTRRFGDFSVWGVGGISYVELLDSKRDTTKLDLYTIGGYDTYYGARSGVTGISHNYIFKSGTGYTRVNLAVSGMQNFIQVDSFSFTDNSFTRDYGSDFRQFKINGNFTCLKKLNLRNTVKSGIHADCILVSLHDSTRYTPTYYRKIRNVDDQTWLLQAYSQWQHKFSDLFTLNLGLHSQWLLLNNSYSVEPRAGIRWQFREKQSLSFGAGMHSQMQTIFTYFNQTLQPDGSYILSNKEIDFSRAVHAIVAYDWNFAPTMRLKAEVYYQYLYSIPGLQNEYVYSGLNEGADFDSPGIDSLVNNGTGRNYGIELTVEKFYSKGYYFLVTASLFRSHFTANGQPERQTAFSGNYVVNLLGGKEFKLNAKNTLSFDMKLNAAGGKRHIPINLAASELAGYAIYDYARAYENRYPGYFRMDGKIGFIHNGKHITQQWAVEFLNFTNHKNVFTEDYNADSNSIRYTYQTGFLVIPSYRIVF
jgi:hypothetical protein